MARKSPSGRHSSRRSLSGERDHGSPHRGERSPAVRSHTKSPPRRERSPAHRKSSHRERGRSPSRDRQSRRAKSPKREKTSSPVSPRTKRLRRAQAEKEAEKTSEMERARSHDKRGDKSKHEKNHGEWVLEKEDDRRELRSEKQRAKDEYDARASKSRHKHSLSPSEHRHRSRQHSRSPLPASNSRARDEDGNSRGHDHRVDASDSLSKMKATEQVLETKEKQKPSFELSGKLAEETNRVRGITLLFTEPPDARKPNIRWRLYVFKGGEMLNEPLYVHRQSCYLFGRERRVADIPTDHPSCSKQHAVLQFRQVEKEQPDGMTSKEVRPYLMDLGSTNKTFINDNPIEPQRYYELFEKDTIRFGNSSREYVLLHENSAT